MQGGRYIYIELLYTVKDLVNFSLKNIYCRVKSAVVKIWIILVLPLTVAKPIYNYLVVICTTS